MAVSSNLKAKENREPWESLFRKAILKEPCFAFTKSAENPLHWFQSLDTFDPPVTCKGLKGTSRYMNSSSSCPDSNSINSSSWSANLIGWPFMPLSKVQMFKCEKCCLAFCSPLNHRRHLRMIHRRPISGEKEESASQRHQLAAFWDNLSPEEAHDIVVNKNVALEDLTRESITRALGHLLQQPSVFALPHAYVKAGAMLLELVRNKSSRLSITSSELFKILDESSEKTFPSFGLSAMYRYVFEGDAGKVGLELKNLVASLGFLVEYNLVNAFIMRKDEEALRYQTALVEEEEASQRKQVEIRDKKKFKKARQKKLREKDLKHSYLHTDQPTSHNDDTDEDDNPACAAGSNFACDLPSHPVDNTHENLYDRLNNVQYESGTFNTDTFKDNNEKVEETDASLSLMEKEDRKNESKMRTKNIKGWNAEESPLMQKQKMYVNDNLSRPRVISASKNKYSLKQKKCVESARLISMSKELLADDSLKDLLGTNVGTHDGYTSRTTMGGSLHHPVRSMRKNYYSSRGTRHTIWARKMPTSVATDGEVLSSEVGLQDGRSPDQEVLNTSTVADTTTIGPDSNTMNSLPNCAANSDICQSLELNGVEVCSDPSVSQVACTESSLSEKGLSIKSVVIGSLSVPFLHPLFDLGVGGNPASYEDIEEITREIEVGVNNDVLNSLYVTSGEESLHALHENVTIQSSFYKDCDKDGKSIKNSMFVNPEGKENQEHHMEEAKPQQSTKIMSTILSKCGETKMWRPVNRGSTHYIGVDESAAQKLSNRGISDTSGNMNLKNDTKIPGAETEPDDCPVYHETSRYKWIAEFLSQRWNEAVNGASGLVILSLKGCQLNPTENMDDTQGDRNNPGMQSQDSSCNPMEITRF